MSQKMTISEFRTFIQERALKMYIIHTLEEKKAKIENRLKLLESGEIYRKSFSAPMHSHSPETGHKIEEPSIDQQVYDEIEMRMSPTDDVLPYSDIHEISETYGMDFEDVIAIMQRFLVKRAQAEKEEIEDESQEALKSLENEGNTNPTFNDFLIKFNEFEHAYNHSINLIKQEFDRLTKDPNQLALFEKKLRESGFDQNGNPYGFDNEDEPILEPYHHPPMDFTQVDKSDKEHETKIEGGNIYSNKYGILTVDKPIITDVIKILERNPDAMWFTNKTGFIDFAKKQHYFSASQSHCFYSPEEMELWHKEHIKTPDAEQSEMLFDTGHQPVQVWDNKNSIGYIIPSNKLKKGIR